MNRRNRAFFCVLGLTVLLAAATNDARADNPPPTAAKADETSARRISTLIEQLGAEDFGVREKAQIELAQAGLEAYDALHAAQGHRDPEIALRSRYLVRSMNVRWFKDTDSPKVIAILKDYGDLQEPERKSRIDRLAALDNGLGLTPLVRLSRYETNDTLAKYATLQILQWPPSGQPRAELTSAIRDVTGNSQRTTSTWLRLFSRTLDDPASTIADWDRAVTAEHQALAQAPERTNRDIVRDLYRFHVELLNSLSRHDEATVAMRQTLSLIDGTPEQVQEMVDWLMLREAWPVAKELLVKFSDAVADRPLLLYRLASIHERLGNAAAAEQTASSALALRPENLDDHIVFGRQLEESRGLEKWAEAEYRLVLTNAAPNSQHDFKARFKLAELLHDRLREQSAAELLKPVVEAISKEDAAKETWYRATLLPTEALVARMHYFYSCVAHEKQDTAKEKEHLQAAVNAYPQDADVLIAMYRMTAVDDTWKTATKEKIQAATAEFRRELESSQAMVDAADSELSRNDALRVHGINCNQFAWLVGNTFGEHQEAVKLSHESVRLCQQLPELKSSEAGFLDTLGRAYYGAGDVQNAIKYQKMAANLNPISGQIRRQLEFFEKEAARNP